MVQVYNEIRQSLIQLAEYENVSDVAKSGLYFITLSYLITVTIY